MANIVMIKAEQDNVLNFIHRRFKNDCNWLDGNCYYFAVILKNRFPDGVIYYDVILGHFIFKYQERFYDWNGIVDYNDFLDGLIEWDKFDEYDSLQKQIIVRDCIL